MKSFNSHDEAIAYFEVHMDGPVSWIESGSVHVTMGAGLIDLSYRWKAR